MPNSLLYMIVCLVWGTTWYAMKIQVHYVPPIWCVAYRMALASLILFLICVISKRSLRFTKSQHFLMLLQGVCLFGLNYLLFYTGTQYIVSGLVALVAASITIINVLNGRLFFKTPITSNLVYGSLLGLAGLILVFKAELAGLHFTHDLAKQFLIGLAISLFGSYFASLGNMVSAYSQKRHKLGVLPSSAFGMLYGTLFLGVAALCFGQMPSFSLHRDFLTAYIYISIFGTVIAFQSYLVLLGRIGPAKVAYVFVITPLIAMLISTWFENFQWQIYTFIGVGLILLGNVVVMQKKKTTPNVAVKQQ